MNVGEESESEPGVVAMSVGKESEKIARNFLRTRGERER